MDEWITMDAQHLTTCAYKLLSGNISVSMIACGKSICVSFWTKSLHFKVWKYSRGDVKEAATPRTAPPVHSESQDVGRAVLSDESSVRALDKLNTEQIV